MNRDAFIDQIREVKERMAERQKTVTHLGLSPMVLMKLNCTHVHGWELVKCPQLSNIEFLMFARGEDGKLHTVMP